MHFLSDPLTFFPFQCDLMEPCDQKVRCINLSPGFRCDPCPRGFGGSHENGIHMTTTIDPSSFEKQRCDDIDECNPQDRRDPCGLHSHCVNSIGSYECTCTRGFIRKDPRGCTQAAGTCPDGTTCDINASCQHVGGNRFRYDMKQHFDFLINYAMKEFE